MRFDELPEGVRVKLTEGDRERLWNRAGNISRFSEKRGFSRSKMYNWKNKAEFIPVELVREVLENPGIMAIKGDGRSRPLRNPVFPLTENNELLTRVNLSVYVNKEGVPVYQTDDLGLVERFIELLNEYGDVPVIVYNRSVYEVRYPKYMHEIFEQMDFEENLSALVDEKGSIEGDKISVGERLIDVDGFEGRLYSRDKRLELALARGDSDEVAELMAEEAGRIQGIS
jgi:hypothetical protein